MGVGCYLHLLLTSYGCYSLSANQRSSFNVTWFVLALLLIIVLYTNVSIMSTLFYTCVSIFYVLQFYQERWCVYGIFGITKEGKQKI